MRRRATAPHGGAGDTAGAIRCRRGWCRCSCCWRWPWAPCSWAACNAPSLSAGATRPAAAGRLRRPPGGRHRQSARRRACAGAGRRLPITIRIDGPGAAGLAARTTTAAAVATARPAATAMAATGRATPCSRAAPPTATASTSAWAPRPGATSRAASAGARWRCCSRSLAAYALCAPAAAAAGRHPRRRASASAAASSTSPFPCAGATNWATWRRDVNTMAHGHPRHARAKRALLLAHQPRAAQPLTRARLNTELLPDEARRRSSATRCCATCGEMGDLSPTCSKASAWAAACRAAPRADRPRRAGARAAQAEMPGDAGCSSIWRQPADAGARPHAHARSCCATCWTTRCATAPTATQPGGGLGLRDDGRRARRARLRPGRRRCAARAPGRALLSRRQRAPARDRRRRAAALSVPAGGAGAWRHAAGAQGAAGARRRCAPAARGRVSGPACRSRRPR